MNLETAFNPDPLNIKKRVPKKPEMTPPYNKTQEMERKARQKQRINNRGAK